MKKLVQILLIVLFAEITMAGGLKSQKALTVTLADKFLTASLVDGYHFNEKAPQNVEADNGKVISFSSLEKQKLTFQLASLKDPSKAVAHLYVCDNANTYCEVHDYSLHQKNVAAKTAAIDSKTSNKNSFSAAWEKILSKAKTKKQFVMLDFGARWCPSCLRLDKEVFETTQFAKLRQQILVFKVDVDRFENQFLLEKFQIKGFPTVVIVNSKAEEISRFVDFQPTDFFAKQIQEAKKFPVSLNDLLQNSKNQQPSLTSQQKEIYWRRLAAAEHYQEALALMESLEPKPFEYLSLKVELAREKAKTNPDAKKEAVEILSSAIAVEPKTTRSLAWRSALVELLAENDPKLIEIADQAFAITNELLQSPEKLAEAVKTDSLGEYIGLEKFYVAMLNADIADTAHRNDQTAWALAVKTGQESKLSAETMGASLRLLSAMIQAKQFGVAEAWVNQLLKKNPADADLQRRKMRILVEQKKFSEALPYGEYALKNSYGINAFFVVEPLAKIYQETARKDQAIQLLKKFLTVDDAEQTAKVQSYKKKFQAILQTLEQTKQ